VSIDLNSADETILDVLSEGRCTVGYLADETNYSRQHIHNRLNVLVAAECVEKTHEPTGLYELRSDPRVEP
jgi:DNA-binding IclR family transcriptional regulator